MRNSSGEVRLRDVISLVLAVAIVVTPWFNGDDIATHGAYRLRFIAIAISIVSLWIFVHQRQEWAEWLNAVLGVILSTAVLWRHGVAAQTLDSVFAGVVIAVFSMSAAIQLRRERRGLPPQNALQITQFTPGAHSGRNN